MATLGQNIKARREALGMDQVELHRLSGVSQPTIANLESGKNKRTKFLPELARALQTTVDDLTAGVNLTAIGAALARVGDLVEIPQYSAGGSMGGGIMLEDQPGLIQSWSVTPEWVRLNVPSHTGLSNLAIVTGFGPSMRPLFNPGDPLLVDRGVKKVDRDAVYFFRVGDKGFIKHLQRVPGVGLVAISENKIYRDWTITEGMDFEVLALVIKVWCGTEF